MASCIFKLLSLLGAASRNHFSPISCLVLFWACCHIDSGINRVPLFPLKRSNDGAQKNSDPLYVWTNEKTVFPVLLKLKWFINWFGFFVKFMSEIFGLVLSIYTPWKDRNSNIWNFLCTNIFVGNRWRNSSLVTSAFLRVS